MTSAMLFRSMMNFIIRNSYFQSKKTLFLLNLLFFLSCSPSVVALKHAPDLTEEGFGFYISRIERKIHNSPDNFDLLLKASKYITMQGFAFQIEKANQYKFTDLDKASSYYKEALVLFEKAIEHGTIAFNKKYENFDNWLISESKMILPFTSEDVEGLYWLGAAFAGAISSSEASPEWVIKIPRIGVLFDKALALDPNWQMGSLYSAMISYTMIRHDFEGNREDTARIYFEKAVELSKGNDLSPYVTYAENVSILNQNKREFTNLLYKALNIDINSDKELRLTNYINYKRAQWLLDNIDEYFY